MRAIIGLVAVLGLAAPVAARDEAQSARIVDEVARCRTIMADAERLACFDRTAGTLIAAREAGDILVMDRTRVVERKRQRFGLALDDNAVFGGGPEDKATEVRALDTTVRAVATSGYGRYNLTLANNMVWQTTEPVRFPPRADQPIHIEKALFGAFRAKIGASTVVKVKRLQ